MTLVDQARALCANYRSARLSRTRRCRLRREPAAPFVRLRVDMTHVTLHRPGCGSFEVACRKRAPHGFSSRRSSLDAETTTTPWRSNSSRGTRREIDIGPLVAAYSADVNELHSSFTGEVKRIAAGRLDEYRRARRISNAVGTRAFWKLILSQMVIAQKRDPYAYLGGFLTAAEIELISALPHRSEQQVDAIIEIVDEEGACNAELRSLLYQAFGRTGFGVSARSLLSNPRGRRVSSPSHLRADCSADRAAIRGRACGWGLRIGWSDRETPARFSLGACSSTSARRSTTSFSTLAPGTGRGLLKWIGAGPHIQPRLDQRDPRRRPSIAGEDHRASHRRRFRGCGHDRDQQRACRNHSTDLAKFWCCGRLLPGDGRCAKSSLRAAARSCRCEEVTGWTAIVTRTRCMARIERGVPRSG